MFLVSESVEPTRVLSHHSSPPFLKSERLKLNEKTQLLMQIFARVMCLVINGSRERDGTRGTALHPAIEKSASQALEVLLFTKNEFRHQAIMNIAQRRSEENDQLQLQLIYTNYRARWCAFESRTAIHRKRCFAKRFSLFGENFRRSAVTVRRSEVFAVAFLQKAVARARAVVLVDVSALCTR